MMPVTLDQVDVADLTGPERTVALYASDMPNGRFTATADQVRAWIVQGAERLGAVEMRRRAEYRYGYRLLETALLLTPEIRALHEARFPLARRLLSADQRSSLSVWTDGMSERARARNGAAAVDGRCPCGGTGRVDVVSEDFDPDLSYWMDCPVHAAGALGGAA